MKSAYEAALERLESQGIARPREEALSDELRQEMAEIRSRATAKLAELEIMHRQSLAEGMNPAVARPAEEEYQRECRRIEERRDDKIRALREG